MKIKFQWFFDFQTEAKKMQVFTVSAGGDYVRQRLLPFFSAYKYYKLGKVSCLIRPSSTLPIDPLGLSYDDDDPQTVDPRDQLSPGLTRITNGEDFFDDISNTSEEVQRAMYLNMMLDTRWYKWSMQGGLKRSAVPKYWQIGQLHQDYFPGATVNVPQVDNSMNLNSTNTFYEFSTATTGSNGNATAYRLPGNSDPRGLFQTGHKGRLSWMPTDALIQFGGSAGKSIAPSVAQIPEIEVYKFITPPMYKTAYYFRCYVTEEVYFSGPIVNNAVGVNGSLYGSLDRFVYDMGMESEFPNQTHVMHITEPGKASTGVPNDGRVATNKDHP